MKALVKVSAAFVFFTCILVSYLNAQRVDLSTDQAVRNELAKITAFSSKLDRLCIERPRELTKIIVIGTHASDSDCQFEGAFVDFVYFEKSAALTKSTLVGLGWNIADQKGREDMAKLWVEKGLLAFSTVLYKKDKDFDPYRGITFRGGIKPNFPDFHPPRAVSTENGEVVVTIWVSFMKRGKMFRHYEFRFTKDGNRIED